MFVVLIMLFICSYMLTISENHAGANGRIFKFQVIALLVTVFDNTQSYTIFDDHLAVSNVTGIYVSILCILYLTLSGAANILQLMTILIGLAALLFSNNLIITFICFEIINISLYLLISTYGAGIKYILTSLILTTFFIFGIVLTYVNDGILGWPLILVFQLKLGILPFHQLTADLYDGISTKIMMVIQLPIKLGIFLFLYLNNYILGNLPVIIVGAAMLIPAISAINAYTFKRFISLSSTSYQTLLFAGLGSSGFAIPNYAIIYIQTLSLVMSGYATSSPIILTLLFLSIAGLPPFIGFYFKLYLVNDLLEQDQGLILILFLTFSLILTANYLVRSSFALQSSAFGTDSMASSSSEARDPSSIFGPISTGILLFWSCFALSI